MRNKPAFSLFEIMIGLALLILFIGIGTAGYRILSRYQVTLELARLHTLCWMAQATALSSGAQQEIIFNTASNSYTYDGVQYQLPYNVQFGTLSTVKGPPSSPQKIVTKSITWPGEKLTCSADGIMNSGAAYLIDRDKTIQVALTSGVAHTSFLRRYRYTEGGWHAIDREETDITNP